MYFSITASVSTPFAIEQIENPTTGYTNTLKSHHSLAFLEKKGSVGPGIGAATHVQYFFEASQPGFYLVWFRNCREWMCEETKEDNIYIVEVK